MSTYQDRKRNCMYVISPNNNSNLKSFFFKDRHFNLCNIKVWFKYQKKFISRKYVKNLKLYWLKMFYLNH